MEFQWSYFKSWKMMLLIIKSNQIKSGSSNPERWCWCCTQYASKFGKLSSGHRTGKSQFSFQFQRRAMPNNVQTTAQLHSSHTLAKFSKPGFNSMWTVNFQMFKLVLETAEEPEVKLPTSAGSSKKQESSRKTSTFALLTIYSVHLYWLLQMVNASMKLKDTCSLEGKLWQT